MANPQDPPAPREPADEKSRISQQIGDPNAAAAAGFKAKGGTTPTTPGAPRGGAGVR
jgi:hypothetical protein